MFVSDVSDPQRDAIQETLQTLGRPGGDGSALLVGWALVTEWMDERGERWLTKAHSASVTHWAANGMHHEALYGDWPGDGDE